MVNAPKKSNALGIWRRLRRLGILLIVSLVGFYVVFYFAQTLLIAQGEPGITITPKVHDWPLEEVTVPVGKETTYGWYLPVENAKGVVLYCHGNGGNLSMHFPATGMHRALGFSTLIFDYGGFGRSTGQPTEVDAGALVLESTYLSIPEAASDHTPWGPWGLLIRYHLSNKDKIGTVRYPVMIIHSKDDTLFPIRHGRGLYERANEPKAFVETHGDHYDTGINKDRYIPEMTAFLDRFFVGPR